MANWAPDPGFTATLTSLFVEGATNQDEHVQQGVWERMTQYQKSPEFPLYAAVVMLDRSAHDIARQAAALALKNAVQTGFTMWNPAVQGYVAQAVLAGMAEPAEAPRQAAGNCAGHMCAMMPSLGSWPELCPRINGLLESPHAHEVEGAFFAFKCIVEDAVDKLTHAEDGPLILLVPKALAYLSHSNPVFRRLALACLNCMLMPPPGALVANMDAFVGSLAALSSDPEPKVREMVCQALSALLHYSDFALQNSLDSVAAFMLTALGDAHADTARAAAEFWEILAEKDDEDLTKVALPLLPQLVPALLARMTYTDQDNEFYADNEANAHVPDRAQDIAPVYGMRRDGGGSAPGAEDAAEGDEDDEDDDDDGDDDGGEVENEWGLRKFAAAALDVTAKAYPRETTAVLMPLMQAELAATDHWTRAEAALLALGAVAEGANAEVAAHMTGLFPFLLQLLASPSPQIRATACYTLGRYAGVVATDHAALEALLTAVVARVDDHVKSVQHAALSALCAISQEALEAMEPFALPLAQAYSQAFDKLQLRNRLVLYDAIGELAEALGVGLDQPGVADALLAPVFRRWEALPDNDLELYPLFECLTSVAPSLKASFQQFAAIMWGRAMRIISGVLAATAAGQLDEGEERFAQAALDLLSGLMDALDGGTRDLIESSGAVQAAYACLQDPHWRVRKAAMGVAGDIARVAPDLIREAVPSVLALVVPEVSPSTPALVNNAAWAVGEIVVGLAALPGGADVVAPSVGAAMDQLVGFLQHPAPLSDEDMSAVGTTIGRLALVFPAALAPNLVRFAGVWLPTLELVDAPLERIHAFQGLVAVLRANFDGAGDSLPQLLSAVASWRNPPADAQLLADLRQIVASIREGLGDVQFGAVLSQLDDEEKAQHLVEAFLS